MDKEKGFSAPEMMLFIGAHVVLLLVIGSMWIDDTKERNKFINLGEVIKLENGDVQVTVTNNGDVRAKNVRLDCTGKTAAGDVMNGALVFYDAVQPKETKNMITKELVQETFNFDFMPDHKNISLSNVKTIQCTLNSVEMNLQ